MKVEQQQKCKKDSLNLINEIAKQVHAHAHTPRTYTTNLMKDQKFNFLIDEID